MLRSLINNKIMGFKEGVQWYAFLTRNRLPLSLRRTSAYSMDAKDLEGIFTVLRSYRTNEDFCQVELGSGTSTLVLAYMLPRLFDHAELLAIEGEDSYRQWLQNQITKHKLNEVASLQHVPLVKKDDSCWFSEDALKHILGDKKVDILIIDAPPGPLCPCARQPAIPFFLSYLKQNSVVFLHDTRRQEEAAIAEAWNRYFNAHYQIGTPRGIDVFEGRSDNNRTTRI